MNISDKVVCLFATNSRCGCEQPLTEGKVYVVESTTTNKHGTFLLRLVGVKSQHYCGLKNGKGGFDSRRFRKLDEIKQHNKQNHDKRTTSPIQNEQRYSA